jgi:glycosyltransferase involved in cell wall biosynthesis
MPQVWRCFPGARLIVAGGTSPFSGILKELAAFMDPGPGGARVSFLENIDEGMKNDILACCDIFATPSGFESFGITILEAWKHRKPVVACRIHATMSLVEEYETGLLVDYKNPLELAAALNELIADPDLRKKLGDKGFAKLANKYSRQVVGKQYHDFYREVLGRDE